MKETILSDEDEPWIPKREDFPIAVALRFRSKNEREEFFGGLMDGWGENAADLHWEGQDPNPAEYMVVVTCAECDGTGKDYESETPANPEAFEAAPDCPACAGSGHVGPVHYDRWEAKHGR